jgi:hypothetical protein
MASILIIDDNDAVRTALDVVVVAGHRIARPRVPSMACECLRKCQWTRDPGHELQKSTSGRDGVALFGAIRALSADSDHLVDCVDAGNCRRNRPRQAPRTILQNPGTMRDY